MKDDSLEAQMVEAVKLAAADAKDPTQRARLSAAAAIFAALRKRDEREHEAWAIVREVAVLTVDSRGYCPACAMLVRELGHTASCPVERARLLLADLPL